MPESPLLRFLAILAVSVAAHAAAVLLRGASRRLLLTWVRSEAKVFTITGFATSVAIFAIYFAAIGFVLTELGISLTTYLASASVIGLAVSFGSQGVVQDVIMGLTAVSTDVLDVGDMVDLGGQVGIVERVGMRFTVLVNFMGGHVFVPNRAIMNVINYPKGYVRAFLDVRLPEAAGPEAAQALERIARGAWEQWPGIVLLPPTVEGESRLPSGQRVFRVRFRIWPGQGAVLERTVVGAAVEAMRAIEPAYPDWRVTLHYRSEPADGAAERRLPRPFALRNRDAPVERG